MTDKPSEISNLRKLISAIDRTGDIHSALQQTGISPARAYQILRGRRGRALLQKYRQLAALQKDIALLHCSSQALSILLRQMRSPENPARQFQAALAVLKISDPNSPFTDTRQLQF